jgi:hypothetical protein
MISRPRQSPAATRAPIECGTLVIGATLLQDPPDRILGLRRAERYDAAARTPGYPDRYAWGRMAKTWLQIRVDLLGGRGIDCDPPPGRVFIVGPGHTFEQLAEAIDIAFARWDLSHLHVFQLADGRPIGFPDDAFGLDMGLLDHAKLRVAREVNPNDEFSYIFDLGDDWRHHCTALPDKIDPVAAYGSTPAMPPTIWGWGTIPDQYGRHTFTD